MQAFYKVNKPQAAIVSDLLERSNKRVRMKRCQQLTRGQRYLVHGGQKAGFKQGETANEAVA